MSCAELNRRMAANEPLLLLDVRECFERDFNRLETTENQVDLHIPLAEIPTHIEEVFEKAEARPIVVYCHHGVRSLAASRFLRERGGKSIFNLKGGIDAWSREVDPKVPRY